MKCVTHLQYEYAQIIVDLFYENVTFVHCSVAVYIHFTCIVLQFYNLDPQCHVAWQERQGLQSIKPLLNVHTYLTA